MAENPYSLAFMARPGIPVQRAVGYRPTGVDVVDRALFAMPSAFMPAGMAPAHRAAKGAESRARMPIQNPNAGAPTVMESLANYWNQFVGDAGDMARQSASGFQKYADPRGDRPYRVKY